MVSNNTTVHLNVDDCMLFRFAMDAVLMGSLCTFGLIGNILSFVIFGRIGKNNASTVLFRALAVSDSLLLLCFAPVTVTIAWMGYMEFSPSLIAKAKIYALRYFSSVVVLAQASTVSISVLLAINRYFVVCKPLLAPRLCTVKNARKQLCCVLLLLLVVMSPRYFETYIQKEDGDIELHYRTWARQRWYQIFKWFTYALFFFIIPFTTILILGLRMVLVLRSVKKKPIRRHSQRDTSRNSVTRLVFVILLVFVICQTPSVMNTLLSMVLSDDAERCGRFQFYFRIIANALAIVNSAVNFLIYAVFNKRFRQILQRKCKAM